MLESRQEPGRNDGREIRVGSRDSALARVQAQMVMDYLKREHPEIKARMVTMKTTGDKILDRTLDQIGGKGLFVKELDLALRDGRTDFSVHSLKDLPMEVPEDLPLIGCSAREDPRDVLVLPEGREGAVRRIGTSSRRRILQLAELFPEAEFVSIRGNLQTRLRKLDEGQCDALVLAAAGMKRMGLSGRISRYFTADEIIPAAGQGILGLQGRKGEDYSCLDGFLDEAALLAATAERAFVTRLDGGCSSPIAAHAVRGEDGTMKLTGFYEDPETGRTGRAEKTAVVTTRLEAAALGESLADQMKSM